MEASPEAFGSGELKSPAASSHKANSALKRGIAAAYQRKKGTDMLSGGNYVKIRYVPLWKKFSTGKELSTGASYSLLQ